MRHANTHEPLIATSRWTSEPARPNLGSQRSRGALAGSHWAARESSPQRRTSYAGAGCQEGMTRRQDLTTSDPLAALHPMLRLEHIAARSAQRHASRESRVGAQSLASKSRLVAIVPCRSCGCRIAALRRSRGSRPSSPRRRTEAAAARLARSQSSRCRHPGRPWRGGSGRQDDVRPRDARGAGRDHGCPLASHRGRKAVRMRIPAVTATRQ